MAIDVAVPRAPAAAARELSLARLVALPARLVLTGIVAISFALRFAAALGHLIPLYFPDEYIYSTLARSLSEHGRPLVRGGSAHFPALLEPILASPLWLVHDPVLAYRLTQAENALAMSLAAVPMYLLARRIGLGQWFGLACAALAVACPDLLYTSFILADPIAYPLALGAIYAGVCALDRPSRRGQLAFLALAGLATFARVQYVFLPVAFLVASLVVERGRLRAAVRSVRLTLILMALPLLAALALGPGHVLGYYSSVADLHVGLGVLRWIGNDAMLLAYASGWILAPAALVGIGLAIARPASRAEAAFGGIAGASVVALFAEAGLYASNGSQRFQERYLFLLVALAAPAFGLWARRERAGRRVVPAIALGLLVLSARVPLSGYTVADAKQDSPFLFAVFSFERIVGIANGSLIVALVALVLACAAAAVALVRDRRAAAGIAFGLAIGVAAVVSVGAVAFDNKNSRDVKAMFKPNDVRWVDHAGLGPVDVLQTDGSPPERTLQQLFWNTSLKRVVRLAAAMPVDAFGAPAAKIAPDGRLLVGGVAERRALLVNTYGTRPQLEGMSLVREGTMFSLYRAYATTRVSLVTTGLYYDGWLADHGNVTIWPADGKRTRGTLRLRLSLPPGPAPITLRLRAPGVRRTVTVQPDGHGTIVLPVRADGPWVLKFRAPNPGSLGDGRVISLMAADPQFVPAHRAPQDTHQSVAFAPNCPTPATQTL